MKVKNRLKRRYVLFALSAVLFLFGATNVSALTKNIAVTDVAIKDKSGTVTVEEPVLSDNKITSNVTFNQKDDFVAFELSIKNGESEKYKIESIEDNNTNENIQIEYAYDEDFISTNESGKLTVKLTYKNALINVDKISINDLTIRVFLISEDGKSDEIIINPTTSDALPYYLAIAVAAVAGLVLLAKKKKVKGIKIGGVIIALSVLLIPLAVLAKEKYETQIEFTNINIIGEFETYNITINPGNGEEAVTIQVQYGDKLESLPTNPSKDGYDFEKWVDGDGNEVTTDTVVTGPMAVEAKYTIKEYNINYDLNGGSLPSDKTNPDKYTILDEVTVNNPEKQGYTFTGWSGTGIDGKTTSLVIPAGSMNDRSYVANYSANTDTPYTVTHRYQNLDDLTTYTESTVTEYGETDKTIPAPRQEKTGFETPAVQNVKVEADGTAHITYTYDRKQILLHINNSQFIVEGNVTGYYPYGSTIHLTAIERPGYTFGWNDGVKTYARDYVLYSTTVLAPGYVANVDTPYVVKHYKQKLTLDGYEIADTQNLTGMTDAPIEPAVNSYTGFKSPAVQHTTIAGDKSTVVNYYYDREMYAFSFNNNENVTSTKPADSYPYETVITLTANEVAGKTFSKWSNDATDNPLTITLTGDLTIEPIYTNNTVTVTFDTGDGSEVASQTVNYGEKATRPAENPTKKNYLFYDWYTTDSYETVFNFNTEITADTTIYARFVPSSFPTVFEQEGECIFNGSDGVLEGENCAYANGENKFIDTGVQLYIAENHKKDYEIGFTIKSYKYDDNVRQATFMNAKLEGNNYPGVVFRKFDDRNDLDLSSRRTTSANARQAINYADEMTVKIYRITNKTTKVQEIFYSINGGGKNRLNDLSKFNPEFDTSVWFGASPTNTSANVAQRILVGTLSNMYIKLGAYEEPEGLTYTVNFDANGGSVSPTSITKDKGDAVGELPTPTDVPSGKEFDGWYTDLGEEGVKVDSSYTPNTGTTLYAKYKDAQYAVTFDTDGGSSITSQTVTYGNKATRPSTDPTKEGYTFDNWYTTNSRDALFDFDNTTITKNTTIYAKFNLNPCKTFATDSWTTIRDNLASDSNYYALGCEKEVEIDMDDDSTPESYKVRLANTSTPEVCSTEGYSQTACGTVIEFVNVISMSPMNSNNTNEGGWKSTEISTYLNGDFYNKLPSDLKSAIIPTYPIVSGSGSNNDSPDITESDTAKNKVYLPSLKEAGVDYYYDNKKDTATDTRTFDFYSQNSDKGSKVKRDINDVAEIWWTRSASFENTSYFLTVTANGNYGGSAASTSQGVAPAFRIGTIPKFTISFETNGGSAVDDIQVEKGSVIGYMPTSKKANNKFDGWYTSNEYTEKVTEDTIPQKDETYYAKWVEAIDSYNLYNVAKNDAVNDTGAKTYTGNVTDQYNLTTVDGIYYYVNKEPNNNVIFGGYCWQMFRTTSSGGVKIIYDGVPVDGKCKNNGNDSSLPLVSFNNDKSSPAFVGYMYNTTYSVRSLTRNNNVYKYGSSVSYDGEKYTLLNTVNKLDSTHHYTCAGNGEEQCESVYFYVENRYTSTDGYQDYVVTLKDGKKIEDAINEMLFADDVNKNDSNLKMVAENWYSNSLLDYSDYIEDTVYCNNRTLSHSGDYPYEGSGWNPSGSDYILPFNGINKSRYSSEPVDLTCSNVTDRFSTRNSKAKTNYPIATITADEIWLVQGSNNYRNTYLYRSIRYWTLTPYQYEHEFGARGLVYDYLNGLRSWGVTGDESRVGSFNPPKAINFRPVVSLAPGVEYISGDGSKTHPYIVDYNIASSKYSVALDAGSGKTPISVIRVTKGNSIGSLPTPIPEDGMEFDGWYTELNGDTKIDSSYVPNANTTVYAKYTDK